MSADDQVLFPLLHVKSIASKEGDNKKNRSTNSLILCSFREIELLFCHYTACVIYGLELPLYPEYSELLLFRFL